MEITFVSTTPVSTLSSYKSLISFFIVAIFSSISYQKNLKSQSKCCPFKYFFLSFNSSPPHKSKSNDVKCSPNSTCFSFKVIKITSNINSAEICVHLGYFVLNILSFKHKKWLKL